MMQITYNSRVFKCFTFVFILIIGSIKADLIDFDASKFDHSQHKITNINTANKPIPNVSSRLGESVLLKCGESEHELLKQLESSSASSSPPVLVNWFKHYSATRRSDKPIYAKYLANNIDYAPHISRDYENRLHISDKIDLNITSLKAVDEALYECRLILFDKAYADSQLGSMYYLQVHMAPEFEYPNEEIVYFKPNVPIRLYCYAKGKPQPTITWYKNGRRLEANTSVLQETFSGGEVGGGDMHEYRCKAENPVGQIEHTVRVIRSGSLFFTEPLKNLTVMEGTILNWPCLAQSNAEITYKWFKDSVSVQSHLFRWSDRGALFQDGMLYLLETYRNDSGLYECHAYTANKRIDTSAYLNVLYGPEIVPFPSPFYTFEGTQSVVIDCVIKSNPSVIALEWFKDKYLLSNTNKYQILANNSLLIRNVKKSDRGNYYCVCNNTIKKTASPLVKLEVFDSKTSEMATVLNAFAHESIRLPCDTLVFEGGSGESSSPSSSSKIKWLKINSVLASNRYDIDSNGSLVLANLKPKDSGYFLCLTNEDDVVRRPLFGERLIKLNVLLNKSEGANYAASFEASGQLDSDNNDIIELPPSPEKLEINQTLNGVQVKWKSGKQTSNSRNRGATKIEYFQIYFREINEAKTAAATNAWKITEPIRSDQTSYLIDDADLVEHRPYEAHIVSFSQHSKSSPSETVKFRYSPRSAYQKSFDFFDDQNQLDLLSSSNNNINNNNQPLIFKNLINVSQLDIVFIAVFVILLFVLMVCVIACIVYRRSTKKCAAKNSKKVEVDEWGFQSSSAATATFLSSSSSSSDKSLNAYSSTQPSQQAKILRNSAIDNGGGVELMHPSNKRVEFKEDDDNDDDEDYNYLISSNEYNNNNINHNSQYLHHHYQQQNQYYSSHHGRTIRRKSLVDESLSRPTTIDESVNHEGDEDDDEDDIVERVGIEIDDDYYYHAKSSSAARRIGMGGMSANKQRYKLSSSNNSSSSSQKKSSSAASSDSSPTSETATNKSNKMLTMVSNSNNTTTTSGVTSESASNSLIHSSDDTNDETANNSNNHHPKKPPRAANNTLDNNNLTTIKYNAKTNKVATTCNKKLVLISANQNSSKKPPSGKQVEYIVVKNNAKSPPPTKYTDEESENNSFLEHSDEINDVSIDVDCSKQIAPPNKDSDSSVASTSSSSASNPPSSTLSPVKYFSSDPQQQPLPFPTSHFLTFQLRNNEKSQQAKQQQLGKLNSSSSLTMVSKMPSTSYAYIEANENEITNNDTLGSITPTMTNNTDTIRIILSSSANNPTSSLSSTSSGCSSLENNNNTNKYQSSSSSSHYHQYYQPSIRRSSAKTAWPSSPSSNKDYITSSQSQQQPQYVKYQNYSTYRPTVKATANLNGNDSNHSSSNKRTSKIDYV